MRQEKQQMSYSHSRRNADNKTDDDSELPEEGESQRTIPPPIPRDPQIRVARAARSIATIQNRLGAGGGRPPLPRRGGEDEPRPFIFDRITHKDFIKAVERRLGSKMNDQMAEFVKQVGNFGGIGSSITALLRLPPKSPTPNRNRSYIN